MGSDRRRRRQRKTGRATLEARARALPRDRSNALCYCVSEQGGMKYCTEWLKSFVTDVPIEFVPAREPFWNPSNPVES
jgi:hypothetical protein